VTQLIVWGGVALALAALGPAGAQERELDGEGLALELLYEDNFETLSSKWVAEGKATVKIENGALSVNALGEGQAQYSTIWLNEELSGDVLVEFTAFCPPQEGASNINLFFMMREQDGADVLSEKHSGAYKVYHSLPGYIVTLTHKWSRLRRCPGFNLMSERTDVQAKNEHKYRVQLLKTDGQLRYFLDGAKIHDWTDPNPYEEGKFAFRTWHTHVLFDDFKVWQVK